MDRNPDFGRARGGGVVVYSKTRFNCVLCEYLNIQDYHVELLTIRLKLTHVRDIYLLSIYRPPSGDVNTFIELLEAKINLIRTNRLVEILIVGDINIDTKRNNQNSKLYNDFLKRNNLTNLIKSNTHFNNEDISISAVDHVITSDPDLYRQHGIIPLSVSDHYAVFGTRKKFKTKHAKTTTLARCYNKYDPVKLSLELDSTDWRDVFNCNDADMAWNIFVWKFNNILNIHAPWKNMRVYIDSPAWLTHEFISECKSRDHYNTYAKRTKNPIHKREAKRIRNKVNLIKKNMKKLYFRNCIRDAGNDSKKLWGVIKQLLRQGKSKVQINEINGLSEDQDIANELATYFSDIGPNLAADIPESLLNIDYEPNPEIPKFNFVHTNIEEVRKLLMSISSAKATGCDGIPIKFLKCNLNISSAILTHIINLSLDSKIVPDGWKIAEVVPLFKSGDKSKPENYRPISILPSASKILERVVHTQVYGFLQQHSLFSNAQFGFRKNHSTTSCILYLTDVIYRNIDIGNLTGVLFLDLKKAFDTVDHEILLKKLHKYNFSMEAVDWFRSYLINRKQLVKVNGVKSG